MHLNVTFRTPEHSLEIHVFYVNLLDYDLLNAEINDENIGICLGETNMLSAADASP